MKLGNYHDNGEFKRISQLPANRKYRNIALAFGIAGIIILLVAIIGLNSFSLTAILFLRGCAGLCAILFIIFVAIYLYRVYKKFLDS